MKTIIFTILSAIVLVSCDNHKAADERRNYEDFTPSYSRMSDLQEDDEVAYSYDYDEEEEDEIDLTANVTYYTSDGNFIYISRDSYGNISGHDMNGNYYSAYTDDFGNTTITSY